MPCRSSSLIAPVALRRDAVEAQEFVEEDAAVRVASAFRHELKVMPLSILCGIIIPQA